MNVKLTQKLQRLGFDECLTHMACNKYQGFVNIKRAITEAGKCGV